MKSTHSSATARTIILLLLPIVAFFLSLSIGRYPVSLESLFGALQAQITGGEMSTAQMALIRVRLPRLILAMIVGASLSVSGTVYQGLFKNPVVSPDLLGASDGAAFGAAVAIFCGFNSAWIQALSFLTGISAVIVAALLNSIISKRSNSIVNLILCGMLISHLFKAFVSLIKFVADTDTKLPAITFWLMGSLSSSSWKDLSVVWLFLPATVILLLVRWKVNILSLGDEEARMLGVNVRFYRWLIIGCATLMTSLSVSVCGVIGWVGLVVPHLCRMIVGPNYGKLVPASMLVGSAFMLLVDTAARMILAIEVPLGILTAIIGAPFFFFLLVRSKKGFT